jgi:hypothetical protein
MSPLHAMPLGEAGMVYIKDLLNEPGLCEKVGRSDLSSGRVYGVVPQGTSLERATKFTTGGLIRLHGKRLAEPHPTEWLADQLKAATWGLPSATLIIQDAWMDHTIPFFHKSERPRFSSGNCIYYAVSKEQLTAPEIEVSFQQVRGRAVAFLCDYALPAVVLAKHEAPEPVMDALARGIMQVIGEPYDQESFAFWKKET